MTYFEHYQNMKHQRELLLKKMESYLQEVAFKICPYKLGQEATVRGKGLRRCVITGVEFSNDRSFSIDVRAKTILKDGSLGTELWWSSWEDKNLQEALNKLYTEQDVDHD